MDGGSSEIPEHALLHSCLACSPFTNRTVYSKDLILGICGRIAFINSGDSRRQCTSNAAASDLERAIDSTSGDWPSLSDPHNDAKEQMSSLQYLQIELICTNTEYGTHFPGCRQTAAAMDVMISGGSWLIRTREFLNAQRYDVNF